MAVSLTWISHASFRISGSATVYIDPWRIKTTTQDGGIVLISHSHSDHWSPSDVEKVIAADGRIIGPDDVVSNAGRGDVLAPGGVLEADGVRVRGLPAYNIRKPFHPRRKQWLGFLIEIDGAVIYYAGDTDRIPEMADLDGVDIALLPAGGKFTMNAKDAAEAAGDIGARRSMPYHWGSIVGRAADARKFAHLVGEGALVLKPGETVLVEGSGGAA